MDSNLFRENYMVGLNGETIKLGKPLRFDIKDKDDLFEVKETWTEPLISDSVVNEIAKEIVRTNENKLIKRIYEMPKDYIINTNACILFWKDGTKTVVKRSKDEKFDAKLAFLTAYFQKHCGMSKTKANKYIKDLEALN